MTEELRPIIDFAAVHRAATEYARDTYFKEYGVYHTTDPQYAVGNERHDFWLAAFDAKQQEHIVNDCSPHWIHP